MIGVWASDCGNTCGAKSRFLIEFFLKIHVITQFDADNPESHVQFLEFHAI
jgi:hypothetical protein